MNELDTVKLINYKAGANEAHQVAAQAIKHYAEQQQKVALTISEVVLVLETTQHQHLSQIASSGLTLLNEPEKKPAKKKPAKKVVKK